MAFDINGLRQAALNNIANNPNLQKEIADSPMKTNMYKALQSGDMTQIEQLGRRFCDSAGMTPEQMGSQALNFFQNFGKS